MSFKNNEQSTPDDHLHSQLRNIQNVIRLTKENIDALNDRFAGFQDPPSFYVEVSQGASVFWLVILYLQDLISITHGALAD